MAIARTPTLGAVPIRRVASSVHFAAELDVTALIARIADAEVIRSAQAVVRAASRMPVIPGFARWNARPRVPTRPDQFGHAIDAEIMASINRVHDVDDLPGDCKPLGRGSIVLQNRLGDLDPLGTGKPGGRQRIDHRYRSLRPFAGAGPKRGRS